MFCHITQNRRGRPLTDRLAIVELISATTTKAGLKIECALDERIYQTGIKVGDAEMAALNLTGDDFHTRRHRSAGQVSSGLPPREPTGGSVLAPSSPPIPICRRWVDR